MNYIHLLLLLILPQRDIVDKKIFVETELQIAAEKIDPGQVEQLKAIISERLKSLDFFHVSIDDSSNVLSVKAVIGEDDLAVYHRIFVDTKLAFWNTYRMDDRVFEMFDNDLLTLDDFTSFASANVTPEVLGISSNEEKLDSIQAVLQERLSYIPNLKLIWGRSFDEKDVFFLYMIDTKGQDGPPIGSSGIKKAEASFGDFIGAPTVLLEFDQRAKQKWGELTTIAAGSKKSIAIVSGNRVLSCPNVMEPILNGQCMISGFENINAANAMCQRLSRPDLPYPLTILSEKIQVIQ